VVPILLRLLVLLFVILSQAMSRVVKLPDYGLETITMYQLGYCMRDN
jgi:hypothetical protein